MKLYMRMKAFLAPGMYEVGSQLQVPAALSLEKSCFYPLDGRLGGLQNGSAQDDALSLL